MPSNAGCLGMQLKDDNGRSEDSFLETEAGYRLLLGLHVVCLLPWAAQSAWRVFPLTGRDHEAVGIKTGTWAHMRVCTVLSAWDAGSD